MNVYHDLFESRFNEMKHDYHLANEARGHGQPSAFRTLLRRLASR